MSNTSPNKDEKNVEPEENFDKSQNGEAQPKSAEQVAEQVDDGFDEEGTSAN